jgi:hypothetical protein
MDVSPGVWRDLIQSLNRIANGEPTRKYVDGHPWRKRDEIALKHWLDPANDVSVESAYRTADQFLDKRKALLDAEQATRRGEPAAP